MVNSPASGPSAPEKLINIQTAAKELGVHTWALRRAISSGAIPAYTPFNSRKLVKLSEVLAYIDACRQGGAK
jgi:excisionase family DNA binding protein